MSLKVLYLGDTTLQTAASYLAGVLSHHGIAFDYVASDVSFPASLLTNDCDALIISDYMASKFPQDDFANIVARVRGGMGLLMIGGWESFSGLGGDYHDTPLADILPVVMKGSDDRVNSFAPCMIRPDGDHPITGGLPFAEQAAAINGYNQWRAKEDAATILSVQRYSAAFTGGDFKLTPQSLDPLLVADHADEGRVACYAGDVAPHWAGGFVDWGDRRCALQAEGAEEIEVGNWYVEFFGNLVKWVAQET
jgi:uncharacterized membrane protein